VSDVRLRIVSDLHYAETGSRVHDLAALEPLFDDARHVVFNGDSVETRFLDIDPHTVAHKTQFDAFVAAHADRLTLITGNHDPDISERHYLDLEGGAVFVTHGDTMFPEMAPWGWEAKYFRAEQERRLAKLPESVREEWDTRLRVCKEAILAIRDLSPRFPGPSSHPWRRRLRFLVAIRRVDSILHAWWRAPDRAARLAETYRPAARVVIVGHTHKRGVWRVRERTIINTGSWLPVLGPMAADFVDRRIETRRLLWQRGRIRLGPVVEAVDLSSANS
jgi:predicted phosphodiesterase